MPDWSYQTVFRPLLFRLEAERSRDLTLVVMGRLAQLPLGPQLIELMGDMRPAPRLQTTRAGITFPSPVGLEAGLDPGLLGVRPLSQFGFGYIEVGPVTVEPVTGPAVRREVNLESIWYPGPPVNPGVHEMLRRLERTRSQVPVGVRIADTPAGARAIMTLLAPHAAFFTVEQWDDRLVAEAPRPVFVVARPGVDFSLPPGAAGVMISGGVAAPDGGYLEGPPARAASLELLHSLRERFGEDLPIIAGGGIHEPADALAFLDAGASMVHIHSGLVYSGPGLPKRINEAVAHRSQSAEETSLTAVQREELGKARGRGWQGALLMAWGIFVGGSIATWIALTRVVLPYDLAFVGLTRDQLIAINPRLLHFMEHDRISLSGTMGASALLYLFLAWYPWRRGEHWARPAYLIPATVGFLAFFLFPGYGYLEPLHAVFYLLLLPFFAMALFMRQQGEPAALPTSLHNDRVWRMGQWGQLLWIVLAAGGTVAGITIQTIGVTSVFVPEDLAFMGTTAEALRAVPRLVPLIAHDRVGFGTALTCNGITVLLMSLWGYRRGARWLWWAFALAGIPSYVGAFGTHIGVGYTDLWHLTPPLVGLVVLIAALICSYPYLMEKDPHRIVR